MSTPVKNNPTFRPTLVGTGCEGKRKETASTLLKPITRIAGKIGFTFVLLALANGVVAQKPTADLTNTSLEDLMNLEVTSVSKKEEKLFQTAAAVYVITQEEIRRSGLTSIPELLRLVPGLEVGQIDGTKWAVSARGFNVRFANKLLVLVDGRSVYSPETSGVYWEAQDVALEDIERIEVIRGPGGTLWGANAVNGVINIITKRAEERQGGLITAGGGTNERGFGTVRYGGNLGKQAYYAIQAKYFKRAALADAIGANANDGQQAVRGGGRLDWQITETDELTLQGDIYRSDVRETATNISPAAPLAPFTNTPGRFTGGFAMGRWTRDFSKRSDMALQVYYDRFHRNVFDVEEVINTVDVDFQHHFLLGSRNGVVWGLGYRLIADYNMSNSESPVQFTPKEQTAGLASGFVQDEITVIKDRLKLTLGSKFENNKYTGFEIQPSARLLWMPSGHQTLWAALSRAVRTPSRSNRGIRVNSAAFPGAGGLPNIVALLGGPETGSEELVAHEIGYRVQPSPRFSLDVATFYNVYDHLQSIEPDHPFLQTDPQAHLVIPLYFKNLMRGETYGVETSANWNPTHRWRFTGGYSYLRMQLHRYDVSRDRNSEGAEGQSPQHQFQFHSYLTLPRSFALDTSLYHVSRLVTDNIPSYTRLDTRVGWKASESVDLSVALQNLLEKQHLEFLGTGVRTSQPQRGVYGKLAWHF
jgi:iron complex outermembrane receptor protein